MSLHAVHWLAVGRIAIALVAVIPPAVSYVAPAPPAVDSGAGRQLVAQARCVFVRPTPLVVPGAATVTVDRYGGPTQVSRHPLLGSAIVSDEGQIAVLASSINGLPRYPCPMPPCAGADGSYLRLDFAYVDSRDIVLTIEDGGCGAVYRAGYDDPVAIAP